jgi:hypothetical protein
MRDHIGGQVIEGLLTSDALGDGPSELNESAMPTKWYLERGMWMHGKLRSNGEWKAFGSALRCWFHWEEGKRLTTARLAVNKSRTDLFW